MKVYRENVTYDLYDVDEYIPVHELVHGTVTMRPYYGTNRRGTASGTLYKLGDNLYVIHDGRWYKCQRMFGVGERFVLLDKYRSLV